jgi:KH-domain-like of EngA bacterial GTPase enzymes, C-terminal
VITATLNMVVREAVGWRSPPSARGDPRKGRIYYATQAATRPPTYVFFVNEAKLFGDDYKCGACWTRAAPCGTLAAGLLHASTRRWHRIAWMW